MKKILIALFVLVFPALSFGSPFLVCDPQEGVTHYRFQNKPAWIPDTFPAQPDGSIRMDVGNVPVGATFFEIAACIADDLWGELCSPFVSFGFTRPSAAAAPNGLKLTK